MSFPCLDGLRQPLLDPRADPLSVGPESAGLSPDDIRGLGFGSLTELLGELLPGDGGPDQSTVMRWVRATGASGVVHDPTQRCRAGSTDQTRPERISSQKERPPASCVVPVIIGARARRGGLCRPADGVTRVVGGPGNPHGIPGFARLTARLIPMLIPESASPIEQAGMLLNCPMRCL